MKGSRYMAIGLFLILALIAGFCPRPILADGYDLGKPIRIDATARVSPIGIARSLGPMAIGGRLISDSHSIWGGELIQSSADLGIDVDLSNIGQVSLSSGGVARIAAYFGERETEGPHPVLIGTLISGRMNVKLQNDAGAYIESCGYKMTAIEGASFQVALRGGLPIVDVFKGAVTVETQTSQAKYIVRPVGMGATTSVRARSTRQIQVQVTDENDKPVPDLPILFTLGIPGNGSLGSGATAGTSFTATTNAQGIATAPFNAGDAIGSNSLTARVEGTEYSWTGEIQIVKSVGFWSTQNKILVGAGAVAAGVATGVAVSVVGDDSRPREQIKPGSTGIRP
jgi:hypothetical protein